MAKGSVLKKVNKALKSAGKSYDKWASSKKVRGATLQAERLITKGADAAAAASGVGEISSGTRTAVGLVKAVGGHNRRTRSTGAKETITSGIKLGVQLGKRYMDATGGVPTGAADSGVIAV